ncbi:uncharacterized protein BDZ83DRAFT_417659 [Colletotrichum acutatum]|uniref:Uncharacterized protein n=1 Tax=Glomerella acutata TaxID=27357 RepID=A0AAD8UGL8_GLOAC|nr:uncharacterized protein BDZ83DRAFT_417659 [Colletotrichum acutatum]KAK1722497.1 hypothetical protein BDZ83DRAFT_417659 [Colletotrichum acutatum]
MGRHHLRLFMTLPKTQNDPNKKHSLPPMLPKPEQEPWPWLLHLPFILPLYSWILHELLSRPSILCPWTMTSRNGRPQPPPVPAILPVATTMDNADPGAPSLGIIVPPAACRREPPSNLQGQAPYEPVKAYSKRRTVCSPWMNEAAILSTSSLPSIDRSSKCIGRYQSHPVTRHERAR